MRNLPCLGSQYPNDLIAIKRRYAGENSFSNVPVLSATQMGTEETRDGVSYGWCGEPCAVNCHEP